MKVNLKIQLMTVVLLLNAIALVGCQGNDEVEVIGKCSEQLLKSSQSAYIDNQENTSIFVIDENTFGVNGVLLNGKEILTAQKENVDLDFAHSNNKVLFENDVLLIEKVSKTELKVVTKANSFGMKRTLQINLWKGNCYSYIQIVQSANTQPPKPA